MSQDASKVLASSSQGASSAGSSDAIATNEDTVGEHYTAAAPAAWKIRHATNFTVFDASSTLRGLEVAGGAPLYCQAELLPIGEDAGGNTQLHPVTFKIKSVQLESKTGVELWLESTAPKTKYLLLQPSERYKNEFALIYVRALAAYHMKKLLNENVFINYQGGIQKLLSSEEFTKANVTEAQLIADGDGILSFLGKWPGLIKSALIKAFQEKVKTAKPPPPSKASPKKAKPANVKPIDVDAEGAKEDDEKGHAESDSPSKEKRKRSESDGGDKQKQKKPKTEGEKKKLTSEEKAKLKEERKEQKRKEKKERREREKALGVVETPEEKEKRRAEKRERKRLKAERKEQKRLEKMKEKGESSPKKDGEKKRKREETEGDKADEPAKKKYKVNLFETPEEKEKRWNEARSNLSAAQFRLFEQREAKRDEKRKTVLAERERKKAEKEKEKAAKEQAKFDEKARKEKEKKEKAKENMTAEERKALAQEEKKAERERLAKEREEAKGKARLERELQKIYPLEDLHLSDCLSRQLIDFTKLTDERFDLGEALFIRQFLSSHRVFLKGKREEFGITDLLFHLSRRVTTHEDPTFLWLSDLHEGLIDFLIGEIRKEEEEKDQQRSDMSSEVSDVMSAEDSEEGEGAEGQEKKSAAEVRDEVKEFLSLQNHQISWPEVLRQYMILHDEKPEWQKLLAEEEYWNLDMNTKVKLLFYLCQEVVNTAAFRTHLVNVETNLRNISAEKRDEKKTYMEKKKEVEQELAEIRTKVKELEDEQKAKEDPAAAAAPKVDNPPPADESDRDRRARNLFSGGRRPARVQTVESLKYDETNRVMRLSRLEAEWKKAEKDFDEQIDKLKSDFRFEPIGRDRYFNQYWIFTGSDVGDLLFQERLPQSDLNELLAYAKTCPKDTELLKEHLKQLTAAHDAKNSGRDEKSGEVDAMDIDEPAAVKIKKLKGIPMGLDPKLKTPFPSSTWAVCTTASQLEALVESLNEKGSRELELKKLLTGGDQPYQARVLNSEYFTKMRAKDEGHKDEEHEDEKEEKEEVEESEDLVGAEKNDEDEIMQDLVAVDEEEEAQRREEIARKKAEAAARKAERDALADEKRRIYEQEHTERSRARKQVQRFEVAPAVALGHESKPRAARKATNYSVEDEPQSESDFSRDGGKKATGGAKKPRVINAKDVVNQMAEPVRKGFFAKLFDIEKDEEDKMDIEPDATPSQQAENREAFLLPALKDRFVEILEVIPEKKLNSLQKKMFGPKALQKSIEECDDVSTLSELLKKYEGSLNEDVMNADWSRGRLKEGCRGDLSKTQTTARFATLLERFYNHIDREESSDNNPPFLGIVGHKKFKTNVFFRVRWALQLETTWETFTDVKKWNPEALEKYVDTHHLIATD